MGCSWEGLERSGPGAAASWPHPLSHLEHGGMYSPPKAVVMVRGNMTKLPAQCLAQWCAVGGRRFTVEAL